MTIFAQIINGTLESEKIFEDDKCIAIKDKFPTAPHHYLVIPKKEIPKLSDSEPEDTELLGHLMQVAQQVAKTQGIGDAFRLVVNNGADAGQSVFHLHLHVIGGRSLQWPPG